MSRPFRVPTKSQTRRFFQENARLLREAYGYDDERVNDLLQQARQIEGGAIEAIRAFEETLTRT
jgi:hypothetical protein